MWAKLPRSLEAGLRAPSVNAHPSADYSVRVTKIPGQNASRRHCRVKMCAIASDLKDRNDRAEKQACFRIWQILTLVSCFCTTPIKHEHYEPYTEDQRRNHSFHCSEKNRRPHTRQSEKEPMIKGTTLDMLL